MKPAKAGKRVHDFSAGKQPASLPLPPRGRPLWVRTHAASIALGALACGALPLPASGAEACLKYEPSVVELVGVMRRRTFPGPPEYKSVKEGDRAVTYWVLDLPRPVCLQVAGPDDLTQEPEFGVTSLQIVITDYKASRPLLGKKVRITGTLFHAHTAHHRTRVLIQPSKIERTDISLAGSDAAREVSGNYRAPTPSELGKSWRQREKDRYAVARGDFDGDGRKDEARIMLSEEGDDAAVIVSLAASGRRLALDWGLDRAVVLNRWGVAVLPPGRYRTACGKGYWECAPGEPEVLVTRWDGVLFFQDESREGVFYMPKRGAAFRHVWLSD